MTIVFRLAFVFAAVSAASGSSVFPIYWNIGEGTPPPVDVGSTWGFEEPRLTATGNGCADPACKSWSQGAFPRLDGSRAINGGVPQAMNLSLHLTTLETTVRDWLPNATASLNGVFDFEAFTTVWAENTDSGSWHSKAYQAYSQQLMAQAHPSWNSSRVAAAAKAAFNAAATNLFVETLKTVAPARRNARFGFYGLPLNALYPCSPDPSNSSRLLCSYDLPGPAGQLYRDYVEDQMSIWEASGSLYPSIYIPSGLPTGSEQQLAEAYVRANVRVCVNVSARISNHPSVLPFGAFYYHNFTTFLSPTDLAMTLRVPYDEGADGLVVWGPSSDIKSDTFWSWMKTSGGPAVKDFLAAVDACSSNHCSGHGRCVPLDSTSCTCVKGWTGVSCSTPETA